MPKQFIKKKSKPNTPGPGFRTSKEFRGKVTVGKKRAPHVKFNPTSFKVQHKG